MLTDQVKFYTIAIRRAVLVFSKGALISQLLRLPEPLCVVLNLPRRNWSAEASKSGNFLSKVYVKCHAICNAILVVFCGIISGYLAVPCSVPASATLPFEMQSDYQAENPSSEHNHFFIHSLSLMSSKHSSPSVQLQSTPYLLPL